MKIPREVCDELHGLTWTDWQELAKPDKADLTEPQKQCLYYYYTRQECREWIAQKMSCDKNTVTRHCKYGMAKIIRHYQRQRAFSSNIVYYLPIIVLFLMELFL